MSNIRLDVVWDTYSRTVHRITKREGDLVRKTEGGMMVWRLSGRQRNKVGEDVTPWGPGAPHDDGRPERRLNDLPPDGPFGGLARNRQIWAHITGSLTLRTGGRTNGWLTRRRRNQSVGARAASGPKGTMGELSNGRRLIADDETHAR